MRKVIVNNFSLYRINNSMESAFVFREEYLGVPGSEASVFANFNEIQKEYAKRKL